jgi:Transglycosylase-like domain
MRKRVLLIAAPLVIVAIAASVAVAAPSQAEHSRGPKLDKLHAERPIAASSSPRAADHDKQAALTKKFTAFDDSVFIKSYEDGVFIKAYEDGVFFKAYEDGVYIKAYEDGVYIAAALASQHSGQAGPTGATPVSAVSYNSNPGDFLSCVRQRESGGNYGVYNAGGSGAAGAYQFLPGTWNSIAASSGRGDLVGLDPAHASPADQDAMAQALYAQQGAAPWGGGC